MTRCSYQRYSPRLCNNICPYKVKGGLELLGIPLNLMQIHSVPNMCTFRKRMKPMKKKNMKLMKKSLPWQNN